MKEALRAELRQDLPEQVSLFGKSIVEELRGRLKITPATHATTPPARDANPQQ